MKATVSSPLGLALPLGKIVAVGRNYTAHAREMGVEAPSEPLLFLKPSTACVQGVSTIHLPSWSEEVHHEVELVVRVDRPLCRASREEARAAIESVAVGLDLTARDHQANAKKAGQPWAVSKGWDGSACLSKLISCRGGEGLDDRRITLSVDGELRQSGSTSDMIFDPLTLLAAASERFSLEPGDLLFTGTPEGVGPLQSGQFLAAELEGVASLHCVVA